jgi:hypothetical protein
MKKIRYTDYFLERLEFREIPQEVVEAKLSKAVERYFDVETGRFIAVQRVKYKGRYKRLLVAYEEERREMK